MTRPADNTTQPRRRRKRRKKARIHYGRLTLSVAILVVGITLIVQIVGALRSCGSTSATTAAPDSTALDATQAAAQLGRADADRLAAMRADTAAMCDFLLEVRARETSFGQRFGAPAADAYVKAFEHRVDSLMPGTL